MKHNIKINGFSYRLRPVELSDAQFIIDVRLEDENKSKFLHKISPDVNIQTEWINNYYEKENDYYFVIENIFTKEKEGLIGLYNIEDNKAEWGRWVLKNGSLASVESVALIYQTAFEKFELEEVCTRTIEDNITVVNFHKSINAKFRGILENEFKTGDKQYNVVEQYVERGYYFSKIKNELNLKCIKLFERNIKNKLGKFKFHHYGIAVKNIEEEFKNYQDRYSKKDYFEDEIQGVRGLFIVSDSEPTLELLENLENSSTLDYYLNKDLKIYHSAYIVDDIYKAKDYLIETLGAKIVSDLKKSVYFKNNICFLMLKNKNMIELIEN